MAQTGYTPILIYSSSTTTNAPAVGNLTNSTLGSELAINITDGKLFYKDNANAIQVIGWKVRPATAGGTGLTSFAVGDTLYADSTTTLAKLTIGASGRYMSSSGTAPQWTAPAALTKTDDTNVTLTLGGSASTALLNAASLTLGWTGTLSVARGGTGLATLTAGYVPFGNGTSAFGSNSLLSWDDANVTLGVGINNPVGVRATAPGLVVGGTGGTTGRGLTILSTSSTATNYPLLYFYHAGRDTSSIAGGEGFKFFQGTTEYARINYGGGFSLNTTTNPGNGNIQCAAATANFAKLTTTTSAAGTCTNYYEVANNFSGISQSFVQGIGPGNSGVSQLSFGVSITSGATTATDVARFDTGGNFRPSADNAYSCGTGALRWSVIYSATALINTSDGTLKTIIGSIDDAEKRVAQKIKAGIKKFKFNDSIAEKGEAARIHWGVVAQDVQAAFADEGLNAEQYGMFCSDTWFEKDGKKVLDDVGEIMRDGECPKGAVKITRLGVRYEELLTFVIASM